MAFEFECTGFHPSGLKTYHNGVRLFHENAFYTIQVASVRESTDRSKALTDLLESFALLDKSAK